VLPFLRKRRTDSVGSGVSGSDTPMTGEILLRFRTNGRNGRNETNGTDGTNGTNGRNGGPNLLRFRTHAAVEGLSVRAV